MSDIAVINHSDRKSVYAWVTHRPVVAMFDLESDAPHCACVARFPHRQSGSRHDRPVIKCDVRTYKSREESARS